MSSETKMRSFGTGALIGVVGMSLSGLSEAVCRTKLGYEHFGLVNLIKVGVLTGGSSALVLFSRNLAQEKHDANVNFNITNKNLEYLKKVQEVHLKKEPKKSHYYKPSQKMQNYRNASSGILGFGAAYGGTKLLDLLL